MKTSTGKNQSPQKTLKIGKKLTIQNLVEYHQTNAHLLNGDSLSINASEITEIDTAALQLIAYYLLHIKDHHGAISWDPPPSPHFLEQVKTSGMNNVLI